MIPVEGLTEFPLEQKEVNREVYSEKRHKNGGHRLDIGGIFGAAGGPDREAASACRAEGDAQAVKKGHASCQV